MKPRLPTSKKWTAFPKEFAQQIQEVFTQNFAKELKSAQLIIEGRIYPQEIVLRVGYLEAGRLKQANFEVSVEHSPKTQNAIERINIAVDASASLMMEYFEKEKEIEGDVDFPLSWKEIEFNGQKIFVQFSTVNSVLESQADELLGESMDDSMVKEESEEDVEENSEGKKETGPKMFGPGRKKKTQLH